MSLPNKIGQLPLFVKVMGITDTFYIYTDEYDLSQVIKLQISELKGISFENIRIHYANKRVIEDEYTNHDQEVYHNCKLYVVFKHENGEWESIYDLLPHLKPEIKQSTKEVVSK